MYLDASVMKLLSASAPAANCSTASGGAAARRTSSTLLQTLSPATSASLPARISTMLAAHLYVEYFKPLGEELEQRLDADS